MLFKMYFQICIEEKLEKRLFMYCRSFKYYGCASNGFLISKFISSASGLSAFAMLLLASLSLGTVLIGIL